MSFELHSDAEEEQRAVLGPLVRVIQEAGADDSYALVGAAAAKLQGAHASSPNLEFMTSEAVLTTLGDMLGVEVSWGHGAHLASQRLHFLRHGVPVFVFGDPVFHGPYESVSPREVPSLWDARVKVRVGGVGVLCTPIEWELVLAVVLGNQPRIDSLREHMKEHGFDSRLVVRLLREGRVTHDTEEAVWGVLERS